MEHTSTGHEASMNPYEDLFKAVKEFKIRMESGQITDMHSLLRMEKEFFFILEAMQQYKAVGFSVESLEEVMSHFFLILSDIHDVTFPVRTQLAKSRILH